MRTMRFGLAAVALLAAAAAPLAAQGGPAGRAQVNALEIILEHRADLALTGEQVEKISELNAALAETNKPHLAEIQKLRARGRPASRAEGRRRMEAMQPYMQQIRENHEQARQEAEALLSEEQRRKARALIEKAREDLRERRPGRPPRVA